MIQHHRRADPTRPNPERRTVISSDPCFDHVVNLCADVLVNEFSARPEVAVDVTTTLAGESLSQRMVLEQRSDERGFCADYGLI